MSKKIKERTEELASKERAIKEKLMGKSGGLKSKANQVGKTALVGGLITLVIYCVYKAFFQGETKSKKGKNYEKSTSGIVVEKMITFLLPYLGKALDSYLDKKSSVKPEEDKEDQPKTD